MPHSSRRAFVLPVFEKYLQVLLHRRNDVTTMIWGWQGNAKRMAAASKLLDRQTLVPFLFRSMDVDGHVTHAAISGLIVHTGSNAHQAVASWLSERRIERFAGTKWDEAVRTHYAVTFCHEFPRPIPYQELLLVNGRRPLDPNMKRGYAEVFLPDQLTRWYNDGVQQWNALGVISVDGQRPLTHALRR